MNPSKLSKNGKIKNALRVVNDWCSLIPGSSMLKVPKYGNAKPNGCQFQNDFNRNVKEIAR